MPHTLTKTVKAFKYDELSEKAKDKARTALWDINVDYEWWDSVYEDAKQIGIQITGFDIGRGQECTGKMLEDCFTVAENIIREHGEHCETYKTAKQYIEEHEKIMRNYANEECDNGLSYEGDQAIDDLDAEFTKSILEDYRIILQEEYEYLTSEEAIEEAIMVNHYDFTEDGHFPAL